MCDTVSKVSKTDVLVCLYHINTSLCVVMNCFSIENKFLSNMLYKSGNTVSEVFI